MATVDDIELLDVSHGKTFDIAEWKNIILLLMYTKQLKNTFMSNLSVSIHAM